MNRKLQGRIKMNNSLMENIVHNRMKISQELKLAEERATKQKLDDLRVLWNDKQTISQLSGQTADDIFTEN